MRKFRKVQSIIQSYAKFCYINQYKAQIMIYEIISDAYKIIICGQYNVLWNSDGLEIP